ncbi:MAG: isochorismate synthase [Thermodesulfobacteriota bacterium]|nr:isochorismate synthase [Thermodesulfobacteriota bacterium]
MYTVTEQIHANETQRIRERIMAQLFHEKTTGGRAKGDPAIVRAEVQVEGLSALPWLCAQPPASRGYWSDRENHFELAGTGRADVITGNSRLDYQALMAMLHHRIKRAKGHPRYLGGLRFSLNGIREPAWEPFKAYRFILPRFEVVTRHGRTVFACNMLENEDEATIEAALSKTAFPDGSPLSSLPKAISRQDYPDKGGWCANVEAALRAFKPGDYEKVVLARKATFAFEESINPAVLLWALKRNTPQCFHFMFQPEADAAFLGASPERLYRRDKDGIRTEAIAGSRPRGASAEEDERYALQLKRSEKDLREHEYVVKSIQRTLKALCSLLSVDDERSIMKLARCQHLLTDFRGKLANGVKDADLLEKLHPTPAVGGHPTDRALQDIARLEPFDRGWYAGPVGWIGKDGAQFVVGIRSALTEGCKLHLFSGAGIVDGSVPIAEWEEIENKISDFLALLTHS